MGNIFSGCNYKPFKVSNGTLNSTAFSPQPYHTSIDNASQGPTMSSLTSIDQRISRQNFYQVKFKTIETITYHILYISPQNQKPEMHPPEITYVRLIEMTTLLLLMRGRRNISIWGFAISALLFELILMPMLTI